MVASAVAPFSTIQSQEVHCVGRTGAPQKWLSRKAHTILASKHELTPTRIFNIFPCGGFHVY